MPAALDFSLNFLNGVNQREFEWIYLDASHTYKHTISEIKASVRNYLLRAELLEEKIKNSDNPACLQKRNDVIFVSKRSSDLGGMQRLAQGKPVANVPRAQQRPARPTAGELPQAVLSAYRIKDEKTLCLRGHQEAFQAWVYLLRRAANLTLREAARRGNVSPSRVSKIQSGLESGPIPATLRQLLERVPKAR